VSWSYSQMKVVEEPLPNDGQPELRTEKGQKKG
jgi:hypothetical protein